ncbi:Structural maintenance of chromosomes protein 3 [Neocucurbitaria cava]|uniref:Structural maintenance of chromosomes protein 3 n=1 Tax=Neocucurbitaria cava TaxID=798079 RepID=A0A9W8YF25_9PLEO|nr:Structural maintenance of chromosomes protein 3 [Neocucurbitaria cava]
MLATASMASSMSKEDSHQATPSPTNYTFIIEIGNQRQHVGDVSEVAAGQNLSTRLSAGLYDKCDKKKTGANTCKSDPIILGLIEHSNERGTVAYLDEERKPVNVNVTSDFIPEDYAGKGALQTAFIDQIVDTFTVATSDDKNCYQFDRTSTICWFCKKKLCFGCIGQYCPEHDTRGKIVRWCNAPEYVRVSLSDAQGKEIAHMRVDLKFQGTTDQGKFDCVGIIDAVDKNARERRVGKLERVVGAALGGEQLKTRVVCESREVMGSCPNEQCLYQLGSCFKRGGVMV